MDTIILETGEVVIVDEAITAPLGEPAVDILGDDAQLVVTDAGSIAAPDQDNTAVQSSGEDVNITNAGEISGALNGISSSGDELNLTNTGTISSDSRAVDLTNGDGSTVTNFGSILGTGNQRNGTFYVNGPVDDLSVTNLGLIDAGEGNLGDGISVQVGADSEDALSEDINIVNTGDIVGRGDGEAVFADGARVAANGSSGVRFFNGSGEDAATVTGSLTNSGTISTEVNVGFLGGVVVEDEVGFEGTITNRRSGEITGPRNGLYIGNAEHDLTINNRGSITSGSRAVNLDGDHVTFNNRGTVLGLDDQRNGTTYIDGTGDNITINNRRQGVIDAAEGNSGSGVSVQVGTANGLSDGNDDVETSANILNNGLIQGRGDGNVPAGVRLFVGSGLDEATFTGNIDNQHRGVIASESEAGILIEAGVIYDGQIINDGLISGGNGLAIDADGALGSVNVINSGTLNGEVRLGAGDDSFVQNADASVTVTGGIGNDNISGGNSSDTVRYDDIDVGVTVDLAAGTAERDTGFTLTTSDVPLVNPNTGINPAEIVTEGVEGELYFNFHTNDFPSGELRGQLELVADNRDANGVGTVEFTATLSGDQEVPPVVTDASGTATTVFTVAEDGSVTYTSDVTLVGLNQDDLLPVDIGNGTLSPIHLHNAEAGVNGPVVVDVANDAGPFGIVSITETDTLVSIENVVGSNDADLIIGNANSNSLEGLDGNDTLDGRDGSDTLIGGAGDDLLVGGSDNTSDIFTGGLGADTFQFETGSGIDIVTDFTIAEDLFNVSAVFNDIDQILGPGGAATQVGTATLIDFGDNSAALLLDVNVNALTSANFVFG